MIAAFWIDLQRVVGQMLAVAGIVALIGLLCIGFDQWRARRARRRLSGD